MGAGNLILEPTLAAPEPTTLGLATPLPRFWTDPGYRAFWDTVGHGASTRSLGWRNDVLSYGWSMASTDSPLPGVVALTEGWVLDSNPSGTASINPVVYRADGFPFEITNPSPTTIAT